MFFSKIKNKCRRRKIGLTDLPIEILSKIFAYVSKPNLLRFWDPIAIPNTIILRVIAKLLTDNIYIHNILVEKAKEIFPVHLTNATTLTHEVNSFSLDSTRKLLSIYQISKLLNDEAKPKKITVFYSITSEVDFECFIRLKYKLRHYFKNISLELNICIDECTSINSTLNVPSILLLKINGSDCRMIGKLKLNTTNVSNLILTGNVKGNLETYPQSLKRLSVIPENKLKVSLWSLPDTVVEIFLESNVILIDSGRHLPNLTSLNCRIEDSFLITILQCFIRLNCSVIRNLQLKHFSFNNFDMSRFANLKHLVLWKCILIPFHDIINIKQLKRLWLLECDLYHLNTLTIPPTLKDIRIAPCDKENLRLLLPDFLKNKIIESRYIL